MPKASIVITCYNLGSYLEEALASALAQTCPDFDVILVDDGSTDPATIALLDRLPPHPRLRVLRSSNQGLARARNYGIAQSSAAYILPLDADDRILPDYLSRAIAILDTRLDVGFVGCHFRTFGEYQQEHRPARFDVPDELVENVVPVASVFRRACWEQLGGYALNMRGIEDWDLWLGILELGYRGEVVPEILFEYRVRPDSMMAHTRQPEVFQERMAELYERHRKLYDKHVREVLLGKDGQFARLLAHSHWLEQQRRSWERAAQERLGIIESRSKADARAVRRRFWWRRQVMRVQRVMAENPSASARARALAAGAARVVRRATWPNQQPPIAAQRNVPKPASNVTIVQTANHTQPGPHSRTAATTAVEPAPAQRVQPKTSLNPAQQGTALTIVDYYPIHPAPRYGHGKPLHPQILDALERGLSDYRQLLQSFLPLSQQLLQIPRAPDRQRPTEPAWIIGFFPGLDALILFGLVSTLKPRLFLEIGSGNSTKFAAKAKALNSPATRIVSVDPTPRVEVDQLCDEVIRAPLEAVDLGIFDEVEPGDIVFFDGSHRVFQNSDVTVFFLEILPKLKSGVYVHIHDILWPSDYPPGWEERYYSEQYMLGVLLLFGLDRFQIIFPSSYIAWYTDLTQIFEHIWHAPALKGIERHGGSFWLQKR
jgi:glycosyltransferase involved in cell wall biosynthesis